MCDGIAIFSSNKKAFHGKKTNSHLTVAQMLKINEDKYLKGEFHWWDKNYVVDNYDTTGKEILKDNGVTFKIAKNVADKYCKKTFSTQKDIAKWLKDVPQEWGRLMTLDNIRLAKLVNPKLVLYQDKIGKFKKTKIEKYNPYQATKLPSLKNIKDKIPVKVGAQVWHQVEAQVRAQVWYQVRDQVRYQVEAQVEAQVRYQVEAQVWDQVWYQVWAQVRAQVEAQVWAQVWHQVEAQVRDQVRAQVWAQVRYQVEAQVWDQVRATSYWAIKVVLGLPINHWFFDFLKLGIMIVFVQGKVKVFGKKGMYLGEYNQSDFK